ncbi:MAG TPA: SagB/ThcOx family dehydrogenase, partial [Candidatus Bathyarchaeia archaeon]|nr:SagB/ThcOx family dehydrogenase [Candidatus Bathyarchaeia archaeon]
GVMFHRKVLFVSVLALVIGFAAPVKAAEPIQLLAPDLISGKPLMQALKERRSIRSYSSRELPLEVLSNLLWAARGINREGGMLTVPTAGNAQEIDVYVAMASGLYLYDPQAKVLQPVLDEDIRAFVGKQDFVKTAPVTLIYVAEMSRLKYNHLNDFYAATDTGFISQNVYLFCASEGLATVVLGWVDKETLAQKMGLKETQKVILTQPVGYPAD